MKSSTTHKKEGFTLLELMVTTTMLAMLTTASMTLIRTSHTAWNMHVGEQETRQAGIAVLRHIVREARQATGVVAISDASNTSGTLSLVNDAGETLVWEHDAANKRVLFGVSTASEVLATGIEELSFLGLRADGIQATTEVGLIHSLKATTKVTLSKAAGTEEVTTSCQAWLRVW